MHLFNSSFQQGQSQQLDASHLPNQQTKSLKSLNSRVFGFKSCIIIMGCGSSVGQVIDSKQNIFKLQQILVMSQQKQQNIANGRIFLFGETRTQRKIIQCETKLNMVKPVSTKTRIPCPKINLDPLEAMYEESQEIFHLGIYGFSMLPPFNKMLALYLQANIIFMCGGRDYDHYNVKNEVFFYSVEDIKLVSEMNHSNELSPRTLYRPKYSRNRFQKMPSMSKKRYSHMGIYSNKLKSVLVFGGRGQNDETLSSCEIYSILENTWRDLPPMRAPRADGHCFEYAGNVYIFGGRSNQIKMSKKIEVYSLQQNSWAVLKSQFKIHRGIENALIFSQAPDQVLIVGGATHSYPCKTVIKINLKEQSYLWDSQLNKEYNYPKGVMAGEEIFIFGGQKESCELFSKKKWKNGVFSHRKSVEIDELQDFSFTRESLVVKSDETFQKQPQICSQNQSVFFGTDDYPCLMIYNKSTGKTRKRAVPINLRLKKNMVVVQMPNKVFMLLGGSDRQQKKLSRSCFFYDATNNTATQSFKMSQKKINFAVVYLENQVYIFGGKSTVQKSGYVACQKYNLNLQKWEQVKRLNRPKYKVFAQVLSDCKIAVFGQQQKNAPIHQIQIYNTLKNNYETFALKSEIPKTISAVYSLPQKRKIVILRQELGKLIETEIDEAKLRQNQSEKEEKQSNLMIINRINFGEEMEIKENTLPPSIKELKQKFSSEYESSELHKNNVKAMRPKMIQIKPIRCESQSQPVRQQGEDSSFEIQRIAQQNNIMMESHNSERKIGMSQKQMPQKPNFEDDVFFSIDTHSIEANLSTLKIKQNKVENKLIRIQRKHSDIVEPEKVIKQEQQPPAKAFQGLGKQNYNIVKRQNQLFFLSQTEIVVFDVKTNERVVKKIQHQGELKLLQLS